jgi:hypothetical protein
MSEVRGVVALVVAPWMVPIEKLSWKGKATFGSTCFLGGCLGFSSCASCLTQSCCSKSAIAAISVCALGEVTALRLGSQVHSLISCKRTWLNALLDSFR